MKKARLLWGFFVLAASCFGQGIPYQSNVFTSANSAPPGSQTPLFSVPFATVTICGATPVGNPCTNTVVIYSNATMSITAHNPITADVHGRFNFWAPAGIYSYNVKSADGTNYGNFYLSLGGSGGGSSISLQHNGTAVGNQNVLNFNDTTPAAPTGNVNVIFGSDSTGKLSAWVPIGGSSFSLTTTGTSGAATYTSGVLNIPDYTYTLTVPKVTALGTLTNDTSGSAAKIDGVSVSGTPGIGQALVALSTTTASWQTVAGSGGISGQTTNCVLKANSATTSNASAALCDSSGTLTASEPVAIVDSSHPSQVSLAYTTGHAPIPAAGSAVYAVDPTGNAEVSENGAAVSRICTAANGICASGTGTVTSVSVTTANGVSGSVATATTTPAITLTLGAITPTSTNGVSAATMAFMDATSSVQTQLNGKQATITNLPNANLAIQTANTVLGALTATTPSGLAMPSCSGGTNALIWTSGTGFGCNTITVGSSTTVASAEVVAFSATPTFSTSFNVSRIVLTANITSFTLGAGSDGQSKTLCFAQGAGPYSVLAPANVHGFFTIGTTNGGWNCQTFAYDASDSLWLATSLGVQNE